jgi:hypothetical protein
VTVSVDTPAITLYVELNDRIILSLAAHLLSGPPR